MKEYEILIAGRENPVKVIADNFNPPHDLTSGQCLVFKNGDEEVARFSAGHVQGYLAKVSSE